ncbi:hypothetical protein C6558_36020 [Ensifer sp. NM-2]|uniref:DUF6941 family protein n=1 Tax=Ensifer sp. NM-2 TaxID=2109730 RepID=UPI000D124F7A|nr:hypothetical protein [Ensifer sp. NM-2]PSS59834.1 hypothetical protein C6558_36020 [Ensifer sp. NM-2]
MALKIDTIFCDDVRQEISGKHTLVGVYGSDIRSQGHGTIKIWIWMRVSGLKVGEHEFDISLIAPNQRAPFAGARGTMEVLSAEFPVPMSLGPFSFKIREGEQGDLVVKAIVNGKSVQAGRIHVASDRGDEGHYSF